MCFSKNITTNFKKVAFISIVISLISQMHINIFSTELKVSFAIILLPITLYVLEDFNVLLASIFSGLGVFLLRILLHFLIHGNYNNILALYAPEILFYIGYGFLFYLYTKHFKNNFNSKFFFITMILIDYLSNLLEMYVRIGPECFSSTIQQSLIFVATLRTVIIVIIFFCLDYYEILLLKKEHAERYKKLLLTTSKLKCEIFWMEKNMYQIENTMSISYELFEKIKQNRDIETWSTSALTIAKDIHEVKKEYSLIVRGIKEALDTTDINNSTSFKVILLILKETIEREIYNSNKNIELIISTNNDFLTNKHYFLMSVFRNLITNSTEAISPSSNLNHIWFNHTSDDSYHIFEIKDDGNGIKEDHINLIFSPGFSTKINYNTGEINRGLGLSLVKDIVTTELQGTITVDSKENIGTSFLIKIPKNILEV